MTDTCECELAITDYTTTKDELGPAYSDWKNIELKYRPDSSLAPTFVDSCCSDLKPQYGDGETLASDFIMLIFWFVASFFLLFLWYRKRDVQPLRFREFRQAITHWIVLAMYTTGMVLSSAAGRSASCVLLTVCLMIFIPMILWNYIVRALQFHTIYSWSKAKQQGADWATIQKMHKRKWILGDRPYLLGLGIVIIPGLILLAVTESKPRFYSHDAFYASLRCYWWQIPEKYQAATDIDDPRCSCVLYKTITVDDFGGNETQFTAAQTVYETKCVEYASGLKYPCAAPVSDKYDGFCQDCGLLTNSETACATCFASNPTTDEFTTDSYCEECVSVLTSDKCSNYLTDTVYKNGTCGYLSEVPHSVLCYGCFSSDTGIVTAWAAYIIALNCAILCLVFMIRNMQDRLLLRKELISAGLCGVTDTILSILGLIAPSVTEAYARDSPNYYLPLMLSHIWSWAILTISFGMPVFVVYANEFLAKKKPITGKIKKRKSHIQSETRFISTGVGDDQVQQLEFAITNKTCNQIYEKFAMQEFTVENIKFLTAVHELRRMLLEESKTNHMLKEAVVVFEQFIAVGAPLQVNISSAQQKAISDRLKVYKDRFPSGDLNPMLDQQTLADINSKSVPVDISPQEIVQLYVPVFDEVFSLVLRDSWSRFMETKNGKEFEKIFASEALYDKARGNIGLADDMVVDQGEEGIPMQNAPTHRVMN